MDRHGEDEEIMKGLIYEESSEVYIRVPTLYPTKQRRWCR